MSTRTAMRDRLEIGQVWRRRRDKAEYGVWQIWRADRTVRLTNGHEGLNVSFSDLRRYWEQVS